MTARRLRTDSDSRGHAGTRCPRSQNHASRLVDTRTVIHSRWKSSLLRSRGGREPHFERSPVLEFSVRVSLRTDQHVLLQYRESGRRSKLVDSLVCRRSKGLRGNGIVSTSCTASGTGAPQASPATWSQSPQHTTPQSLTAAQSPAGQRYTRLSPGNQPVQRQYCRLKPGGNSTESPRRTSTGGHESGTSSRNSLLQCDREGHSAGNFEVHHPPGSSDSSTCNEAATDNPGPAPVAAKLEVGNVIVPVRRPYLFPSRRRSRRSQLQAVRVMRPRPVPPTGSVPEADIELHRQSSQGQFRNAENLVGKTRRSNPIMRRRISGILVERPHGHWTTAIELVAVTTG